MKHDKYSNFENNKVKKNNYSSVSVKTKNKKIKNFNLRYAYKILDSLIKNEEQKLTPLAQNTGINFNRCKNYVVIMENNFEWVKQCFEPLIGLDLTKLWNALKIW